MMIGVDKEVLNGFVNWGEKGEIKGIGNVMKKEVIKIWNI